ncbi:SLAP domain-containing protein [Virgibacillus halodenitrificans]|uniref:SLAP domain-containing protein n=1 Tax=Virgibacillus halodenitrificans TaxID=1482 RepID=UPI00045D34B1|nr:SLAP domain-containing protein [Virgibacillus halodenitrificans]CDQ36089.1 hypothetical protein BN993_05584 [Virgibacillus halodenitrificans]
MQTLIFETAWDKTIAPRDREQIEALFIETKDLFNEGIHFIPIRQAVNHRGDLLISVLIHNFSQEDYLFDKKTLQYKWEEKIIASHTFTLPFHIIKHHTSMPWTFIFPKETCVTTNNFTNGEIKLINP